MRNNKIISIFTILLFFFLFWIIWLFQGCSSAKEVERESQEHISWIDSVQNAYMDTLSGINSDNFKVIIAQVDTIKSKTNDFMASGSYSGYLYSDYGGYPSSEEIKRASDSLLSDVDKIMEKDKEKPIHAEISTINTPKETISNNDNLKEPPEEEFYSKKEEIQYRNWILPIISFIISIFIFYKVLKRKSSK